MPLPPDDVCVPQDEFRQLKLVALDQLASAGDLLLCVCVAYLLYKLLQCIMIHYKDDDYASAFFSSFFIIVSIG
jgi:hypothetical protein